MLMGDASSAIVIRSGDEPWNPHIKLTVPGEETIATAPPPLDPEVVGESRVVQEPARELYFLLNEYLPQADKDAELERLRRLGHRGDFDGCLLESCVIDDPVEILKRHFSGAQMRTVLIRKWSEDVSPHASSTELALSILSALGFRSQDDPVNPRDLLRDIEAAETGLPLVDRDTIVGQVTRIARRTELVLMNYLRFLIQGVLQYDTPDDWLRNRKSGGDPTSLAKATLGQMINLLGRAAKDINKSDNPETKKWRRTIWEDHAKKAWRPQSAEDFTRIRNRWIHPQEGETQELSTADVQKQAADFCRLGKDLLNQLLDGALPETVTVSNITLTDGGGRPYLALILRGTQRRSSPIKRSRRARHTSCTQAPIPSGSTRSSSSPLRAEAVRLFGVQMRGN